MTKSKTKTINVNYLARVEGEGALYIKYDEQNVQDVKLKIFEPPRFFEAMLRGRDFKEAPDITSRICGICPIAYQMSAVHAMENALGLRLPHSLRELRRLCYCGEWIESHSLHIYMLHAPDFLGYENAVQMAKAIPNVVERGLRLKKAGNAIVSLLGGREIHPINIRVGGFYRLPTKAEMNSLKEELKKARDEAIESVRWTSGLSFPEIERDYELISLSHPNEYPLNEGRIISTKGLDISVSEYDCNFKEEHVSYTNALHTTRIGHGAVLAGPIARYNINFQKLSPLVKELAKEIGLSTTCRNPYKGILIRGLEVLYAFDEALRILNDYITPDDPYISVVPHSSTGFAVTEAPRGLLYHRYSMDEFGKITDAKIVPPTSVNQKPIEHDLKIIIPKMLHLEESELTKKCEQAIRNHDPCISCSTHFLKLNMEKI